MEWINVCQDCPHYYPNMGNNSIKCTSEKRAKFNAKISIRLYEVIG
jgi:hypothetical protein